MPLKLCSVETTPSPNCIKLNLDEEISAKALTLQGSDTDSPHSPVVAQQLLTITGIKSVFLVKDFITLTKENSADWQPILTQAANLLGEAASPNAVPFTQIQLQPLTPAQPDTS